MPCGAVEICLCVSLGFIAAPRAGAQAVAIAELDGRVADPTGAAIAGRPVAGGQANGINYLLDGGDNNDAFSNVNLPLPFPDALREFSVQTNALPAQFGLHPGAVVNAVTKSGSNGFHGDVFEFLRNGVFNARQAGTLLASNR